MTSRILPQTEWHRLAGTEAETVWPHLDPENARVLVVEDNGRIVGTWTVMRLVHVECLYIDPSYRNSGGVARRLLRGMRDVVRAFGAATALTGAMTDEVSGLIGRLGGVELPGRHFVIPVKA